MGDGDNKNKQNQLATITPPLERDSQGELFPESLVKEMLDVERKRIESMDKKTETARMFIEASDAADKRQFEYQMARLQSEDLNNDRKHRLGRVVILGGGSFLVIGLLLLLGMMFWGSPTQSALAQLILEKVFIGVGGYGVLSGIIIMIRKMLNQHIKPS